MSSGRSRLAIAGVAAAFAAVAAVTVSGTAGQRAGDPDPAPTFYADVLPILEARCQECHRPGGRNLGGMVAPMAFTSYEETRPWAPLMAAAVKDGRMPPWHADPAQRGVFKNERYITDEEKATLLAWVEAGAPAGEPTQRRHAAAEHEDDGASGWSIGEPHLVVQLPEPFFVEDDVEDQYVNIPIHISAEDLPEPRWVKAIEFLPSSPVVHHIIAGILGGIAPGQAPTVYPDGYGVLFPAGPTTITFQMHYHKHPGPGTGVYDQSKAGVAFYEPGDVIERIVVSQPQGIFDFVIPPGDPNFSATHRYAFGQDSYIRAFTPHMHLRGKAARFELEYPDGRRELLLNVPDYDFNWQHTYEFREPVFAPEGSVVHMTLWWDNSADNPHNPDPTVAVRWGQPTTDEMGFGFMTYTHAEPVRIVVGEPLPEGLELPRSGLFNLGPATGAGGGGGAVRPGSGRRPAPEAGGHDGH